jgi:hypothetical protein
VTAVQLAKREYAEPYLYKSVPKFSTFLSPFEYHHVVAIGPGLWIRMAWIPLITSIAPVSEFHRQWGSEFPKDGHAVAKERPLGRRMDRTEHSTATAVLVAGREKQQICREGDGPGADWSASDGRQCDSFEARVGCDVLTFHADAGQTPPLVSSTQERVERRVR